MSTVGCRPGQSTFLQLLRSPRGSFDGNFKPDLVLGNDPDVMALFHFNEGAGGTAYDSSGGVHVVIENAAWVRKW
jgi:hypothetical protein